MRLLISSCTLLLIVSTNEFLCDLEEEDDVDLEDEEPILVFGLGFVGVER